MSPVFSSKSDAAGLARRAGSCSPGHLTEPAPAAEASRGSNRSSGVGRPFHRSFTILGREGGVAQDPDLLRVVGEAVMALGTDIVFVVDATSLRMVHANLAFTKVLGYPPDEIAGLDMRQVSASEARAWEANLTTLVETGRIPISVRPFRQQDSHIVEIEPSVGRPVVGGRTLYCVVGRDPTERYEAERIRRESELRMRTFVDAAFEGLTVTDKGRIVDANARLAEIMRAPLSELVGRPVIDFVAPESRADV